MVSQCANPGCGAPFLYFRDGKLFAVRRSGAADQERVEFFWLCGECNVRLKMEVTPGGETNLVPRPRKALQTTEEGRSRSAIHYGGSVMEGQLKAS